MLRYFFKNLIHVIMYFRKIDIVLLSNNLIKFLSNDVKLLQHVNKNKTKQNTPPPKKNKKQKETAKFYLQCFMLFPFLENSGNSPVVITWISREHELYSSVPPISLVEHCVTFRHDRRLLSLLGFVHNWPTSRWSSTKKKKKRKTGFYSTEMESCCLF